MYMNALSGCVRILQYNILGYVCPERNAHYCTFIKLIVFLTFLAKFNRNSQYLSVIYLNINNIL